MIKYLPLVIGLLFLLRCNIKKRNTDSFTEFVFSQAAMQQNYSMKFTKSDTLYLEERFPKPVKRFWALVPDSVKMKLNTFLDTLELVKFDTAYIQSYLEDGVSYKFYLHNDTLKKTINIYGHEAPKELYLFAQWLDHFVGTTAKHPSNKEVDFGDLSGIIVPSPPSPPRVSK